MLTEKDNKINVVTFPPIDRLMKSDAFYYKVESLDHNNLKMKSYISLPRNKINASEFVRKVTKRSGNKISCHLSDFGLRGSQLSLSPLRKNKLVTTKRKLCESIGPRLNNQNELSSNINDTNENSLLSSSLLNT